MGERATDLLLKNGWIVPSGAGTATGFSGGLAVAGGRVSAIGSDRDLESLAAGASRIVELQGRTVVPGFHDAHLHLADGALTALDLNLRETRGAQDVVDLVRARAGELPKGEWVRGFGWDAARWSPPGTPELAGLDRAAPDHPVFLSRVDGHAAWLNSCALARLDLPSSGLLLEEAAESARRRLPRPAARHRRAALVSALRDLARHGITSAQDVATGAALTDYELLAGQGRLNARIDVWLPIDGDLERAGELRERHPAADEWLSVSTLKLFLDGTLGSHTAALDEAYHDEPTRRGQLRVSSQQARESIVAAAARGWRVAVHAVGERAVGLALDAFEAAPATGRRIEHVQCIRSADLKRMAELGVIASIQPVHLLADRAWVERRLGTDRAQEAYPWNAMARAGVVLALGTDWPVAPLSPLRNLAAVLGGGGTDSGGIRRLSFPEALGAYTDGPARALGKEGDVGRLRPGQLGDFVVLSENPAEVPPDELEERVQVLGTYVDGRCVYASDRSGLV